MASNDKKESKTEEKFEFSLQDVTSIDLMDCGNYYLLPSKLDPDKDENVVKLLCISDTHNKHNEIQNMPSADILIHCGDFTMYGKLTEIKNYDKWIENLVKVKKKYKYAILIAGNHDITLEQDHYNKIGYLNFHDGKKENVFECNKIAKNGNNIYLEDTTVELCGVKFYGTPYQPEFSDWAFNLPRGKELAKEWAKIPENGIDVLLTHGPPKYHGDKVIPSFSMDPNAANYYGCNELLKRVNKLNNIQYHIYGHIHDGFGASKHKEINTTFVNASTLNSRYYLTNKPIMLYIKGKGKDKNKQQQKNDSNDNDDAQNNQKNEEK